MCPTISPVSTAVMSGALWYRNRAMAAKTKPAAKSKTATKKSNGTPKAAPAKAAPAKGKAKAEPARISPAKVAAAAAAPPSARAARPTQPIRIFDGPVRSDGPLRPITPAAPPAPAPVDQAARVGELWRRLETWVTSTGAPPLALNAGATEKAIAAAEKTMKLVFPPDFRASLAVHDGQAPNPTDATNGQVFPWMPGCPPLLSVARILERWKEEQELAAKRQPKKEWFDAGGKLKGGVYRTGRIPVAGPVRRDSERTFLDMDPGPSGTRGQLITMVSAADFVVIDASFAAAFERWVNVLERGIWIYDTALHTVHPRALAPATSHPSGLFSKR
jgi:cell wall assembly regulator SMI1